MAQDPTHAARVDLAPGGVNPEVGEAASGASPPEPWTAIVLAGKRPGIDPLATGFGQEYKALVPLAGEPMLAHVLKTLLAIPEIASIAVLAQDDLLAGPLAWAGDQRRIIPLRSRAGISDSIARAVEAMPVPGPVLVTTADHPLLTSAIVRKFMAQAVDSDAAVGMVERDTLLASFPESRRTWLRFRDGAFTGANLFGFRFPAATAVLAFWRQAEADRKRPWRLFRHFGPSLLLRVATRTISLHAAIALAGRRLGVSARMVELEDAVAGIDVDRLADHALAERLLSQS